MSYQTAFEKAGRPSGPSDIWLDHMEIERLRAELAEAKQYAHEEEKRHAQTWDQRNKAEAELERVREILRRLEESEMTDYPKSIDDDIKDYLSRIKGGEKDG